LAAAQIATNSVLPPVRVRSSAGPYPLDVPDYVLFLSGIWLCCALGIYIRLIGPAFIVAPVGICLLYAAVRRAVPPRLLFAYFLFALSIATLSKYQMMPDSWQKHFLPDAIIRQLAPLLGFFAVSWAARAYFHRRILNGDVFWGAPVVLILSIPVVAVLLFAMGAGYEGDHSAYAILALFGSPVNNMSIALFFIFGAIFFTQGWRRHCALALVLVIAATTHFLQFRILAVLTVAIVIGIPGRKVVMSAIMALLMIYAIGANFVPEAMRADPNAGLRLAFIPDTLASTIDSNGLGVGYGKESVRWIYRFPGVPDFTFLPDARTMSHARLLEALSTGVENSYLESLLRSGILGCLLLTAAIFAAFPPPGLPRDVENHAALLFAMLFICTFVNSSLESPISVVGLGFVYGYLLALRTRTQSLRARGRIVQGALPIRRGGPAIQRS
jgi:hypothetical protein